jgi:hypothetical protein
MVAVIVALVLGQAAPSGVLVTSTSRQGVAAGTARELLALVATPLKKYPAATGQQDLTSCKRRLPCLLKAAKDAHATWLVGVEAARVVNQVIVKVSLFAIEEDGRTVATTVVEGSEAQVRGALISSVETVLGPHLDRAWRPPTPPPPDPVVTTPPPPPDTTRSTTPAVTVVEAPAAPAPSSGVRTVGLIVGAVGVAGLVAAGVFGGLTLDAVGKRDALCPPTAQCNDARAFVLHDRAALTQDLGTFISIGAGAALVTGVVLFFVGAPASPPAVSFFATPSGAAFSFSSRF